VRISEADRLEAQADAESDFNDTCRVERPTGEETTDPDTWEVTPVVDLIYPNTDHPDGRCKFQTTGQGRSPNQESGGYQFTVLSNECHLPFGLEIHEDDVITCVTSENPSLPGLVFRVTGYAVDSYATASRIPVERHGSA